MNDEISEELIQFCIETHYLYRTIDIYKKSLLTYDLLITAKKYIPNPTFMQLYKLKIANFFTKYPEELVTAKEIFKIYKAKEISKKFGI